MLLDAGLCDVSPPVACHRSFLHGSPWIPGHTYECHECITLPLFVSRAPPERPSKLDPDCCSHDDLIAFVRATQERSRGPPWFQLCHLASHDFEVYCLTHLRQWAVTFLASQSGPRTATVITFHKSTEHVRRVPDKLWQNDALAVNLVAKFLLQHTHVGSRELSILRTAFSTAPSD